MAYGRDPPWRNPLSWRRLQLGEGGCNLAKAATWLSQIHNPPEELSLWLSSAATRSTTGLISSPATPLLASHRENLDWKSLQRRSPVCTSSVCGPAPSLVAPGHTCHPWSTSVTDLTIDRFRVGVRALYVIPLAQVIAFVYDTCGVTLMRLFDMICIFSSSLPRLNKLPCTGV